MKELSIKEVQVMQIELMQKLHEYLAKNNIKYYLLAGSSLGAVRHKGFIPWDDDIDVGMFRNDYEKFLKVCSDFDSKYDIINFHNAKNCNFCLTRIFFPYTKIENMAIENTDLDKRLYLDIFPLDNVPNEKNKLIKYEKEIMRKKKIISRIDVSDYNDSFLKLILKKIISMFLKPFRNVILKRTDRLMKKYQNYNTEAVCSLFSQYSFDKQVMDKKIYGEPTLRYFDGLYFYFPEKIDQYLTILYGKSYMKIPEPSKRRKPNKIYLLKE